MSATYTLRRPEGTCTFYKITIGRRWVGRVAQHADGTWIGVIGSLMTNGHQTAKDAFDEVVARHLGYPSAETLHERNARVRESRKRANAAADALAQDVLRGDYSRVDKLGPEGLLLALGGVNRALFGNRKRRGR